MIKKRKLKYAPYSNARVIDEYNNENDKVIKRSLVSYDSTVIIIEYDYDKKEANLFVTGEGVGYGGYVREPKFYSQTTVRHIRAFLREFTSLYYSDIKEAYYSGEVLTWKI